ncbi:hypothetical protein [Paenibacillus hemerocallicola]|nr:hypothetical protein [Paenibacillus hemerocallicola]
MKDLLVTGNVLQGGGLGVGYDPYTAPMTATFAWSAVTVPGG